MAEYTDIVDDVEADKDCNPDSVNPNTNYSVVTNTTVTSDSSGGGLTRRGLFGWNSNDFTQPSNVDEVISCVMRLNVKQTNIDSLVQIMKTIRGWTENQATWNKAHTSPDDPWTTPGGDFDATALIEFKAEVKSPATYYEIDFDILSFWNSITDGVVGAPEFGKLDFLMKRKHEDETGSNKETQMFNYRYVIPSQRQRILVTYRDWAPTRVASCSLTNKRETDSVFMNWSNYAEPDDIATYKIYRETDPISDLGGLTPIQTGITDRYWTDAGANDDTLYYYAIEAIDGRGNSFIKNMNDFSITTQFAPEVPAFAASTIDSRKLLLEWDEATDSDFQKYDIWSDITGSWAFLTSIAVQGTTSYEHTVVDQSDIDDYDPTADTYPDGRTVNYKLRVYDNNNNYSETGAKAGTTIKPIQPLTFTAIQTYNVILAEFGFEFAFDWAKDATPAADFDRIDLRYEKETDNTVDETSTLGGSTSTYPAGTWDFTGLDEITIYRMVLVAYDEGGLFRLSTDETYAALVVREWTISNPSASIIQPPATTIEGGDIVEFDARRSTDPSSDTISFEDAFDDASSLDNYNITGTVNINTQRLELVGSSGVWLKNQTFFGEESRNNKLAFKYDGLGTGETLRFRFRKQDDLNFYFIDIVKNTLKVDLYKVVAGSGALLQSATLSSMPTTQNISVILVGNRIRVWAENESVNDPAIDYTDSSSPFLDGTLGFFNTSGGTTFIDDLSVYGRITDFQSEDNEGFQHEFGDGDETAWGEIELIQHTYYIPADIATKNYIYRLLVTNKWGAKSDNIESITFTVNNADPVAVLFGQAVGFTSTDVFFNGSNSSDPEGGALDYFWDWDDGSAIQQTSTPYVSHQFAAANNPGLAPPNDTGYTVQLRVRDEDGNYSTWVSLLVYIYDTGAYGYDLVFMCPFDHIGESQPDGLATSDSANLDFTIVHQMRGGSKSIPISGIHHDPDESHDEATRIVNMRAEADLVQYLSQNSIYVKITLPVQSGGDTYGFIRNHKCDMDEDDLIAMPFSFDLLLITPAQITEM